MVAAGCSSDGKRRADSGCRARRPPRRRQLARRRTLNGSGSTFQQRTDERFDPGASVPGRAAAVTITYAGVVSGKARTTSVRIVQCGRLRRGSRRSRPVKVKDPCFNFQPSARRSRCRHNLSGVDSCSSRTTDRGIFSGAIRPGNDAAIKPETLTPTCRATAINGRAQRPMVPVPPRTSEVLTTAAATPPGSWERKTVAWPSGQKAQGRQRGPVAHRS